MRLLRYLLPILLIAIIWYMIQEFVVKDRPEGIQGLKERLWESAQRLHWSVGVVAVLIIVTIIIRFLVQVIRFL